MLVQNGTLHLGDIFVAGSAWGRVRALINDRGEQVKTAWPAVPVEVLGLNSAPEAGDTFAVVESEVAGPRGHRLSRAQAPRDARCRVALLA